MASSPLPALRGKKPLVAHSLSYPAKIADWWVKTPICEKQTIVTVSDRNHRASEHVGWGRLVLAWDSLEKAGWLRSKVPGSDQNYSEWAQRSLRVVNTGNRYRVSPNDLVPWNLSPNYSAVYIATFSCPLTVCPAWQLPFARKYSVVLEYSNGTRLDRRLILTFYPLSHCKKHGRSLESWQWRFIVPYWSVPILS